MPRIHPVQKNTADPDTVKILDMVEKKMGIVPNIIGTMAQSRSVANAYLGFSQSLASGQLAARMREQIALAVGEANNCDYCLAAHTALGQQAGLTGQQTCDARLSVGADEKETAALRFARKIVNMRGMVSDDDVEQVRQAGYSDGDIAEIVANVALNLFTNYFNHVAETTVDFPAAPELAAA